ncbi:hypothetical protein LTSEMON_1386 [Salmonella enterica subsp. enterica serovar Montevideo str. S5-403]|uniref:Uncharacterized protein n=1 Tax=Salmonella enterica subsp. enterica serovar Montevideo str. S5-403 TaxID=913242 RepID=G5Q0Q4_SALMO|nr:hypothetical protein LTSEJOH_5810 [Salmonella enterica subsp. enterica serovar Johannesburg str. S5-703]EHC81012.1 hypothetical protein LTSEMON_1386 [Salmonella enterica subsp. enterica serovar Montevideo str. S5-403]
MQSAANLCAACKRPQDAKAQQRRRLAGCFAQNFFCKIFMIQTAQAGAV